MFSRIPFRNTDNGAGSPLALGAVNVIHGGPGEETRGRGNREVGTRYARLRVGWAAAQKAVRVPRTTSSRLMPCDSTPAPASESSRR